MDSATPAATALREARHRAGLTQRELAALAGTPQSAIARIERGVTDPSSRTLQHLLAAAGFDAVIDLRPRVELDRQLLDDVPRILALSPEERIREVGNVSRFLASARRG